MKIKSCNFGSYADVKPSSELKEHQSAGLNGRAQLYWRISVILFVFCLLLLAVILALAIKLSEVQSAQPCPERANEEAWTAMPQACSRQVCHDMYPTPAAPNNVHQCCGKNWLKFEDSCYFMSQERLNWQESREICQKWGGDLVVIKNERQQKFLTNKGIMLYWIGLSFSQTQKWTWINNTTLTQSYWALGYQPTPHDYCALLSGRMSHGKNWYPNSCAVSSQYICQRV